ncbi:MAG: lycopene cyclase family protein [Bacteroidota bacterium]
MTIHPHYDYIISGSGCAGLSLLMRMMQEPFFDEKQILVVDKAPKTSNDRTWCFWERGEGLFEPLVYRHWNEVDFYSSYFSATLPLSPYRYKMIRGIDFYRHIQELAATKNNIHFLYETVLATGTNDNTAFVKLTSGEYSADYVFNSILFDQPVIHKGEYMLLQHFKGWVIETEAPVFNPAKATFMDFRVSQEAGTTFMYVLPLSEKSALVEYTLFTEQLLPQEKYESELYTYLKTYLGIEHFNIEHEEFGIIPMTNHIFPAAEGRVINMGIAGGQAKGSSGYAFQFIQKKTDTIVKHLVQHRFPAQAMRYTERKFRLYDSVLLNVLQRRILNGDRVFANIFQKNKPALVLRFLNNESSIWDDLQIMNSVPTGVFLKAAIQELLR